MQETKGDEDISIGEAVEKAEKAFSTAMDDDLNAPKALASIYDFIKDVNKSFAQTSSRKAANEALIFLLKIDKVLGLELDKVRPVKAPDEVKKLVEDRENARKNKDFAKSDEIRTKISKLGFEVEDTQTGPIIKKKI
jgi:cysteinyl-tRNA synthetase